MKTKKYNWILYLITATIITTIAVQFYWNYKNYQENKKRVTNEIQISLDNAIDVYYSNLSKNNFFAIINSDTINHKYDTIDHKGITSHNLWIADYGNQIKLNKVRLKFNANNVGKFKDTRGQLDSLFNTDSIVSISIRNNILTTGGSKMHASLYDQKTSDSLKFMRGLHAVYIALSNDIIDFIKLDSIVDQQLKSKGIQSSFYFNYTDRGVLKATTKNKLDEKLKLFTNAKSTYLSPSQELKLYHSDPTLATLRRSSTGILLSFLLSLTVISSLFYLLKIINKQKELAEIKNDLISNITHEFKTPIATISTAIEAIENFNVIDDKEKTQKYLSMSSLQLSKLNQMVEKLLETATLDSEKLMLKKEPIDLVDLVTKITNKHELLTDKKINFSSNVNSKWLTIDLFHFENAISNLIDNAIKYGGDTIEVNVNSVLNNTEISIADDGDGIEKNQQEKIFDKFYRIPKGNRHDVKGFGIGLYYTKKIVEKHGGFIHLVSNNLDTVFKISLPNE
ncbi:MAG: HAMP domain-containing histidine kinase [Flavobacteriaceae bacterium]|nr:HAMP domain-containing histidine kinase [Flavobacteriaceae bacterium]